MTISAPVLSSISRPAPQATPPPWPGLTRFEGGLHTNPAFAAMEAGLTYNQALDWLQQPNISATINRVGIEYDPDDWRALAQARFYLRNGQTWTVTLPHNEQAFVQQVQQARLPFFYSNHHTSRSEAFRHVASHTAQDALLPLLVFSLTTLTGLGVYNKAQGWMASRKLGQLLQQALKTYPAAAGQRINAVLNHLPEDGKRLVSQFMAGHTDLILAEGPPGTGKTHLLDGLAAHAQHTSQALVLEVGGDMGDVRDLLYRLYSGDAVQSRMALKSLQALVPHPVKQLVLRVDELEDVAEDLQPLITKGMGNGPQGHLPRLRVLATCNRLPNLTDAVKNRVNRGRMFMDYPTAANKAMALANGLTGKPVAASHPLVNPLTAVLRDYPGYSMRSLQDALRSIKPGANPAQTAQQLKQQLHHVPLDDTEMAGVLRHALLDGLPPSTTPVVKAFINRHAVEATEQAVKGLDTQLNLNGQAFHALVNAAMVKQAEPVPLDPDDLITYIQQVARTLRTHAPSLLAEAKSP